MDHNFSEWVYCMWERNCEERESYGEEHLTFGEYKKLNALFLIDAYIKDKEKERASI